jgi:hypothetical protein
MKRRILLLVVMALFALALFTPAAIAQDDDDDDDDDGAVVQQTASLPDTGGPALAVPVTGALLLGSGVAGVVALNRRNDS